MKNLPDLMRPHHGPMTLSGGLAHAIRFAEALDIALDGLLLDLTVSGVRDGLFFYDHVRDRGVLVTMNNITSCGRTYLGLSRDFKFDTKAPMPWLKARDWHKNELDSVVRDAVAFLVGTTQEFRSVEA